MMKFRTNACRVILPLLLALAGASGRADSFSAEVATTRGGQTTTGTFNYQDKSYRFDLVEGSQKLIVLYDGQTGVTRLIAPPEKSYSEAAPGEPMGMFANPFSAYAHLSKTKTVRTEGTESVAGVSCRKQVVLEGEQVWVIGWTADEYEIPLKVEIPVYGISVELRNIKRGPQDAALFALPAGYKLRVPEAEPEPGPDWAGQIAGAPLVTLPFEKELADGAIVRVPTQAGRRIRIEGTNLRRDQGSFTALALKDGKSRASDMGTTILDPGDSGAMYVGSQPKNADELAVRVGAGPMKITITYAAPSGMGPDAEPAPAEEPAAAQPPPEAPAPEPAAPAAEVSGPPAADIAARIEISWTGPGNSEDFISVARPGQPPAASINRARVRDGNPVKVWAPSEPGQYEIRYVQARGAKVLARAPLTVNPVATAVEPPSPADVAARIEVPWQGPAAEGDFISVALPRQPPAAAAARVAVRSGNPAKLWLPADAGQYEVRYVLGRGNKVLATAPLVVQAVTATVEPPVSAKAGTEIEIRWQGPGYPEDFIAVARTGQPLNASLSAAKVQPGRPVKLKAPREPGNYEVRYVLGRGPRLLAKGTITIRAQ